MIHILISILDMNEIIESIDNMTTNTNIPIQSLKSIVYLDINRKSILLILIFFNSTISSFITYLIILLLIGSNL